MIVAGIKQGDEVICPANSFIASAWAIVAAGARPVFCDVENDLLISISKIKKAKTDSLSMPESGNDLSKRPEIENLINIYSSCSGISKNTVIEQFSSKEISYFKEELSQVLINLIQPICSEAKKLYEDKMFLNQVLSSGAIRARQISQNTISDVYKIAGMI